MPLFPEVVIKEWGFPVNNYPPVWGSVCVCVGGGRVGGGGAGEDRREKEAESLQESYGREQ